MDLTQAVIQATTGAFGANTLMRGTRTIIPVTGTLTSMAVYVGANAGNFAGAVLDTTATTRNVLYNSGAIAVPGTGWQVIGNPNLAVTQGQHLDFAVGFSSGSNTVAFFDDSSTGASFTLPTGYLVSPLGGVNLIVWNDTVTPGSYGATVAESELSTISAAPLIIGQVT